VAVMGALPSHIGFVYCTPLAGGKSFLIPRGRGTKHKVMKDTKFHEEGAMVGAGGLTKKGLIF